MPLIVQGNGGVNADVAGSAFRALNVNIKPIDHGVLGHYRITQRILTTAAQVANARLLTLRNAGTNLIIPTRLVIRAAQVAAGTAQENSVDVYRYTNFTVQDTTNVTIVNGSPKRSSMPAAPGNAQIRVATAVAAGMTGGTLTKDAAPIGTLPFNVAAAINTTSIWGPTDVFDDFNGTHPLVLAANEGIGIENRVLNVTSYGIALFVDLAWVETTAY